MNSVKLLCLSVCLSLVSFLYGNTVIDSLKNAYQNAHQDTLKIEAAHELFKLSYRGKIAEATVYNQFIRETAKRINYPKGMVYGAYGAGILDFLKGQFGDAISKFRQASEMATGTGLDPVKFQVNIASVYQVTGKLDSAVQIYEQCIEHFEQKKNYVDAISALNNLGVVYSNQGNYKRALTIYEQAYDYALTLKDTIKIASFLLNIGNSHYDLGNQSEAVLHLLEAVTLSEKVGDKRGQSIALSTLGEQYLETGQPEQALNYLEKAGRIKKQLNYLPSYAKTLRSKSRAYLKIDNYNKAKEAILEAISIQESTNDIRSLASSYFTLAQVWFGEQNIEKGVEQLKSAQKLSDNTNNKPLLANIFLKYAELINEGQTVAIDQKSIDALDALDQAEQYLSATDRQKDLPIIYQAKANWFAQKGDFVAAYQYSQATQILKDSLYSNEKIRDLEEMRTKYETMDMQTISDIAADYQNDAETQEDLDKVKLTKTGKTKMIANHLCEQYLISTEDMEGDMWKSTDFDQMDFYKFGASMAQMSQQNKSFQMPEEYAEFMQGGFLFESTTTDKKSKEITHWVVTGVEDKTTDLDLTKYRMMDMSGFMGKRK